MNTGKITTGPGGQQGADSPPFCPPLEGNHVDP